MIQQNLIIKNKFVFVVLFLQIASVISISLISQYIYSVDDQILFWTRENSNLLAAYIAALVSLVAIAVNLPTIFFERETAILATRRELEYLVRSPIIQNSNNLLRNLANHSTVYSYSVLAILIIAGYLIPAPIWMCNPYTGEGWWCILKSFVTVQV